MTRDAAWRRFLTIVFSIGMVAACGCQSKEPHHPVSGKVLVDGKAAGRAKVFFVPLNGSPQRPSAETLADGSFEMTGLDGATAGEYAVTVIWPTYALNGGEEIQTGDQLKGRFANPDNPVAKIAIRAGENVIPPWNLKSR